MIITRAFNVKSHCTPSKLKSKLIKLIFFERKEVRLLYIGATGFRLHTTPTIFVPVLCLLCLQCLYYVYYACTKFAMPVPGLPGFFCSRIPNFQQLDAKIKWEIPNFLWFLLATRNKLSISGNLLYP